MNLYM